MKHEYENVAFYKVNTLNSPEIRDRYADGGSKPYFKFYKDGVKIDEVKYQTKWDRHEPLVRGALIRHNNPNWNAGRGTVKELANLNEYD